MAQTESLSSRERKEIIEEAEKLFENPAPLLPKKGKTVKHIMENGDVAYVANNSDIVMMKIDGRIIPSLKIARNLNLHLPKVVVDIGAIKFVTNGADIMRPGITHIDDGVLEGELVVVVEERNGAPLSFGIARYDAVDMRNMDNGKVVTNVHYLKDDWFNFIP